MGAGRGQHTGKLHQGGWLRGCLLPRGAVLESWCPNSCSWLGEEEQLSEVSNPPAWYPQVPSTSPAVSTALNFISITQHRSRAEGDGGSTIAAFRSPVPKAKIPPSQTQRNFLIAHSSSGFGGLCKHTNIHAIPLPQQKHSQATGYGRKQVMGPVRAMWHKSLPWPGMGKLRAEKPQGHKCGNKKSCPEDHFAFKIISGAANVVGPSICFDDMVLASAKHVDGHQGAFVVKKFGNNINKLDTFLQEIEHGTIVLTASYDDAATKMNDKVRTQFVELGSSHVSTLGFRDNWVFLGAKGLKNKSPFEEHIKNDEKKNKYDGWPEMLEMEGCAPRKMD
uniref:FAM3 metabolism regulating signaling molecule D n=1 Tax=Aquila chrysaetos chrysaetos TaxID=223781 RepID=A0A663F3G5_AQUCH